MGGGGWCALVPSEERNGVGVYVCAREWVFTMKNMSACGLIHTNRALRDLQ